MTDEKRVAELLRRAGPVEEEPTPEVWDAIRREVTSAEPEPASRQPRRGRKAVPLLLAAAAGAALMYAASGVIDREDDPTGQVLATGTLAPVEDDGDVGTATVLERGGRDVLRVELDEPPDPDGGYLEVWLLRPDVSGLITLGVLDGTSGEYLLPAGVDLVEYPVVDISVEQVDGDPGHGGNSVLRGEIG